MKKTSSLINLIVYLLIGALICSILFIYSFSTKLGNGLIICASDEVKRLTTIVMNNCIKKYVDKENQIELLEIERNNKNEIERIKYNTKMLNQTSTQILDLLENDLNTMVKGKIEDLGINLNKLSDEYYEQTSHGILFTISMGSSTGNPLLANIGPKIPLNLKTVGNTKSQIKTKITEYGLNNALIEVSVELSASIVIQMPFISKEITIKNTVPLTMELIQGVVPETYLNSNLKQ